MLLKIKFDLKLGPSTIDEYGTFTVNYPAVKGYKI